MTSVPEILQFSIRSARHCPAWLSGAESIDGFRRTACWKAFFGYLIDVSTQVAPRDVRGRDEPLSRWSRPATVKSPSAVSRFCNHYSWNIRAVIRAMRQHALDEFERFRRVPYSHQQRLELIVDMTSLHKEGKFEQLEPWIHRFNGVNGVHLVVLYLCHGSRRFPWSFLVWRGKGQPSPADLALKMLTRLPDELVKRHSRVPLVLADAGFCSKAFIAGVVQLGLKVSITIPSNRVTAQGHPIGQVTRQRQAITLPGLPDLRLWLYWVWLSNSGDGTRKKRYVISTLNVVPDTIRANGRKRWRIEALFKTLKSRFGLHRSGQYTKRGMLRYCCLCFLSDVLCHLETLEDASASARVWPDWRAVAQQLRRKYCGLVRLSELRKEIQTIEDVLDCVLLI
ncbi:IS4/IS5 family transposase (plasmid) [Deinococcus psychrotolerans]|uniref:IS4/IS5 family transposase n=1 Tax=Deinococcus psychrotolerans TaxID=2489213 RepID=A0A3G8YUE3_9DEIO|nr:transposase [Deinococcus psychrotolerans]AZI45231.1 IS4/IS5 family transposase [Deinococcus psychrotolerans]